jgi:hypothetical protein
MDPGKIRTSAWATEVHGPQTGLDLHLGPVHPPGAAGDQRVNLIGRSYLQTSLRGAARCGAECSTYLQTGLTWDNCDFLAHVTRRHGRIASREKTYPAVV